MTFLQTSGGKILLDHFVKLGANNINAVNREQTAQELIQKFTNIHGAKNVRMVAAKANQKLKCKFYAI
jgi:hypothetical protein